MRAGMSEVLRMLGKNPVDCVAVEEALHAVMQAYEVNVGWEGLR